MNYYCDIKGKVYPISWLAYEKLMLMGWVHRIMDEKQTVVHWIGGGRGVKKDYPKVEDR